jgi:hypothetical protein
MNIEKPKKNMMKCAKKPLNVETTNNDNTPYKFKVEIEITPGTIVKKVYYVHTLGELSVHLVNDFPKGKVIGILGG